MEPTPEEELYNTYVLTPYDEVVGLVTPEWIKDNPYFWYDRVMLDTGDGNYEQLLDKYVSLGIAAQVRPLLDIASKKLDNEAMTKLEKRASVHAQSLFLIGGVDKYDAVLVELVKWKPVGFSSTAAIVSRALSKHTVFTSVVFSKLLVGQQMNVISIISAYQATRTFSEDNIRLHLTFELMVTNPEILEPYFLESSKNALLKYHEAVLRTIIALDIFPLLDVVLNQKSGLSKYIKGISFDSKRVSLSIGKILRDHGVSVTGPVYVAMKQTERKTHVPNTRKKEMRILFGKDHEDVIKALDTGVWPKSEMTGTRFEVRISGPSGTRSLYLVYGQDIPDYSLGWNPTTTVADYLKAFKPSPVETISIHVPN